MHANGGGYKGSAQKSLSECLQACEKGQHDSLQHLNKLIQHTHCRTAIFHLAPQNNHLKMVTALHSNATRPPFFFFFSPEDATLQVCYSFLSRKSNSTGFDAKCLLPNVFLGGMQIKFLKIFLYTEKPVLCLEEQITEPSPLNKLCISNTVYYLSSYCQDTANYNTFRRQSIC